jgi:hypothetical protein
LSPRRIDLGPNIALELGVPFDARVKPFSGMSLFIYLFFKME